ncbi:MAG: hypothetical protein NT137_01020 [Methanomassiliicoccales archaeon]|nr:hypothetical protein [Methanomassiliicoccales archaeon]
MMIYMTATMAVPVPPPSCPPYMAFRHGELLPSENAAKDDGVGDICLDENLDKSKKSLATLVVKTEYQYVEDKELKKWTEDISLVEPASD